MPLIHRQTIHPRTHLATLLWVAALLLIFTIPSAQAQSTEQQALGGAVGLLSQRLGVPITIIDSYTAEVITFSDTSFGCPASGQAYASEAIVGYKFLIVYQGVRYDIRVSADGGRGVICDAPGAVTPTMPSPTNATPAVPATVGLATYRTETYSIAYPEFWNVVNRTTDIYFGPGNGPACAQPGMTVTALGAVGEQSADALLQVYDDELTTTALDPARTSIRTIGRSATYQIKCADGSLRQARVTVFVAYGRGVRVVQFAPQADFAQWMPVFAEVLERFSPSAVSPVVNRLPITRPGVFPLAMVAHIFAGNVYTATLLDWPGVPITSGATPTQSYRQVVVSPLGQQVAFTDAAGMLWVAAAMAKGTPLKLAEGLVAAYPVAWSPDGSALAYVQASEGGAVVRAARADGSGSRSLGTVSLASVDTDAACRATSGESATARYEAETGKGGNALVLFWARDGAIYLSAGCDGRGLLRLRDGVATLVHDQITRVSLSPDQTQALALLTQAGKPVLVRLILASGEVTLIKTVQDPDQAAWGADGQLIVYSTLTLKEEITLDAPVDQERGMATFGTWPYSTAVYQVQLHELNLVTGEDRVRIEADGRGIGRIAPSPDGVGVLFSLVQDDRRLIEAFNNNVPQAELNRLYPETRLYWRPFADAEGPVDGFGAHLLAVTSGAVWGPLGSAVAPTPTGGFTIPPGRRTLTPTPAPTQPSRPRNALPTNTPRSTAATQG